MIRPEDEPKINEMTIALRLSRESACILLVSFNDELLRRDVEAEIKRRLEPEGFNFREFRVTGDGYRNLPIMLVDMKPQPGDIFLIFDLKKAMPEVSEYLNYRREDFVEHNISAIFWLDEPTLTEIARKALDFYAFRSLPVFEFKVDRSRDMIIPDRTTPSEMFIYNSLEELDAKIVLREEILKDYLEKRPEDRSTIAGLHNDLAILYHTKSQFPEAEAHWQKALELYREIKDRRGEAIALGNMGVVYRERGDLDRAVEHYLKALQIHRRIGYVQGEVSDLGNIGSVYQLKGDLDKALEHYSKALEIDRRIGYVLDEAIRLGNMGAVYGAKGDLEKALEYYLKALEIDRRIGNVQGKAIQLGNMGVVYQVKGDLNKALDYMKEALRIFISIGVAMSADIVHRSLQNVIGQMEAAGMELSDGDRREIAELTEEYERLKGETADATTPVE